MYRTSYLMTVVLFVAVAFFFDAAKVQAQQGGNGGNGSGGQGGTGGNGGGSGGSGAGKHHHPAHGHAGHGSGTHGHGMGGAPAPVNGLGGVFTPAYRALMGTYTGSWTWNNGIVGIPARRP